jgi:hypothetical protein
VGTIAIRIGNPVDTDLWEWRCGFYPGSHPRECTSGTATTFDQARAEFESAWRIFLAKRTEADFQAWRDQQAWTAEKYRRFDRGERMPHDWRARLTATPDVTLGGRTERAIDLRLLQLVSDIRPNRRDTQLLSVATRKPDLCESGFLSLLRSEKKRSCRIAVGRF